MTITITTFDLAVRLLFTLIACALIGMNRSERGEVAGLRTTMLVGLASSLAMILTGRWLITAGHTPAMFASLDLMRLPLGVLTGMGFIGGGAILRRGNVVQGVTTAATLWIVTVLGLCFGGGEIVLGVAATALALAILWGLKPIEARLRRLRQGEFAARIDPDGPSPDMILDRFLRGGLVIHSWDVTWTQTHVTIRAELQWHVQDVARVPPVSVADLAALPGVQSVRWSIR